MTIRRKEFKEIAKVIREHNLIERQVLSGAIPEVLTQEKINDIIYRLIKDISIYFEKNNPTLDRGEFMRDCGWYNE